MPQVPRTRQIEADDSLKNSQAEPILLYVVLSIISFLVIVMVTFLIGFTVGWFGMDSANALKLQQVVAMKWGDGRYGPAFYGAHVYLEPAGSGYSVRALVYIGRGNNYFHDCGELGVAQTDSEAVARWGNIDWRKDGLHIGSGADEYFLARAKLESHR